MPYDLKYGRVAVERGTIADDEPVVVFRAQDEILPALLDWYAAECIRRGSPDRHIMAIGDARAAVTDWQQGGYTQVPQSATYERPTAS